MIISVDPDASLSISQRVLRRLQDPEAVRIRQQKEADYEAWMRKRQKVCFCSRVIFDKNCIL